MLEKYHNHTIDEHWNLIEEKKIHIHKRRPYFIEPYDMFQLAV